MCWRIVLWRMLAQKQNVMCRSTKKTTFPRTLSVTTSSSLVQRLIYACLALQSTAWFHWFSTRECGPMGRTLFPPVFIYDGASLRHAFTRRRAISDYENSVIKCGENYEPLLRSRSIKSMDEKLVDKIRNWRVKNWRGWKHWMNIEINDE